MRRLAVAALLLLAACGQKPGEEAVSACDLSAERYFIFNTGEPNNTAIASAAGPSCAEASVKLTLLNPAGGELISHESTYAQMAFGGAPAPNGAPATSEAVQAFLDSWVEIPSGRAGELPAWAAGAAAPGGDGPFVYRSDLNRTEYERLRAANGPLACFASDATHVRCITLDDGATVTMADYGS